MKEERGNGGRKVEGGKIGTLIMYKEITPSKVTR